MTAVNDKLGPKDGKKWTILSCRCAHINGTTSSLVTEILPGEAGNSIQQIDSTVATAGVNDTNIVAPAANFFVSSPIPLPMPMKSGQSLLVNGLGALGYFIILIKEEIDLSWKKKP